ncbi:MAG: hypothetical protein [Olavius algarvensis Gamma 3 endosymbiont]|nr:MAG: hypothetical protein [Olavius algarvensis Gamma 3 endosymbiont]
MKVENRKRQMLMALGFVFWIAVLGSQAVNAKANKMPEPVICGVTHLCHGYAPPWWHPPMTGKLNR